MFNIVEMLLPAFLILVLGLILAYYLALYIAFLTVDEGNRPKGITLVFLTISTPWILIIRLINFKKIDEIDREKSFFKHLKGLWEIFTQFILNPQLISKHLNQTGLQAFETNDTESEKLKKKKVKRMRRAKKRNIKYEREIFNSVMTSIIKEMVNKIQSKIKL
ncbi:hypothetical protein P4256_20780 [Bacillus wiedmannii]|uniref:hypothetical protein n=1 Tax=Bacillus wiedmannii TaxID=1890302 RepID=UPI002E1BEAB4|nr:hypothetical protein [Bacillus wiedmannii]